MIELKLVLLGIFSVFLIGCDNDGSPSSDCFSPTQNIEIAVSFKVFNIGLLHFWKYRPLNCPNDYSRGVSILKRLNNLLKEYYL